MSAHIFSLERACLALALVGMAGGCSATGGGGQATAGQPGAAGGSAGTDSGAAVGGFGGDLAHAGSDGGAGMRGGAGADGSAGAGADGAAGATGGSAPVTTVVDGPMGEAFDTIKGVLDVDYAGYLSKHDVVFNTPNTNPIQGLTVGNGRVGAIAWSQNGLTMQVSAVDSSQQTAFSAGLVSFNTNPAIDAGTPAFQQRLSMYDGTLATKYGSDHTVTIVGAPNSEVIGLHVVDTRAGVTSATVDVSLWDVSALGNSGNVPNLATWEKVTTWSESASAGLSRGQQDPNSFGYSLGATVEGAPFTTQMVDGSHVRLTITPSASYTIWIAAATRLNAPNNDSVTQAKAALAQTAQAGFASTFAAYETFWHGFWAKSFVQYSNGAGDA
ncbi:MAG TPA: hypothetical protein VH560_19335, partial [Polyangia bacterium]|nr:hypothetical protein [Polyangia bacterium]